MKLIIPVILPLLIFIVTVSSHRIVKRQPHSDDDKKSQCSEKSKTDLIGRMKELITWYEKKKEMHEKKANGKDKKDRKENSNLDKKYDELKKWWKSKGNKLRLWHEEHKKKKSGKKHSIGHAQAASDPHWRQNLDKVKEKLNDPDTQAKIGSALESACHRRAHRRHGGGEGGGGLFREEEEGEDDGGSSSGEGGVVEQLTNGESIALTSCLSGLCIEDACSCISAEDVGNAIMWALEGAGTALVEIISAFFD